jgi:hypothetical protein
MDKTVTEGRVLSLYISTDNFTAVDFSPTPAAALPYYKFSTARPFRSIAAVTFSPAPPRPFCFKRLLVRSLVLSVDISSSAFY